MTMPSSGPLNMGGTASPVSVAQELGLSLTATITMNDAAVRTLAGVGGSGTQWSMNSLYGKSKLPAIGAAYEGGFFAGQVNQSGTIYNIVIGPKASARSASKQWKVSNTSTAGTDSVINGPTNSANMNNVSHPAAQFCEALTIGGYTDWYLPAKNELEVCYYNLKPSTTSNDTTTGANPNAVPSRGSNYTAGTPAQTSVAIFQFGGAEAFSTNYYWSSTQDGYSNAWMQFFSNGVALSYRKDFPPPVRAIRRVAA